MRSRNCCKQSAKGNSMNIPVDRHHSLPSDLNISVWETSYVFQLVRFKKYHVTTGDVNFVISPVHQSHFLLHFNL